MTVTGIRHGLLLICVFLGGQSDTEHFSKALVMDRWAYGSDSFGEDIGNTGSLSNHGFHKPIVDRTESQPKGAPWCSLASACSLCSCTLSSTLTGHQLGSFPPPLLCMSFLPKMTLPILFTWNLVITQQGSHLSTSRDVINRTLHLPLIVFAIRLGTPLGAVLPLLVMLGMVPGTSRGFKQCLSLNCVKKEKQRVLDKSLLIKPSI